MSPTQTIAAPAETVLSGWRKDALEPGPLPDCSLIVPTYQRGPGMLRLIQHLAGLPDAPGEVVVVDGSSDDRTDRLIRESIGHTQLPFDLIFVRSPAGLTRQRNVGIDATSGRIVFFLDDDCLPEPGYFRAMREAFDHPDHARVGAVCGSITNEMSGSLPLRWRLRLGLRLIPSYEPGRYFPTATSVSKVEIEPFEGHRSVDMVPGGAAAYRREALAGTRFSMFFDGYAQGEDMEMSCRLRRSGWQILWCGNAHVIHEHAPDGRPPRYAHGRMAVRNRYFIWRRYSPDPPLRQKIRFWADVGFGLLYDLAATPVRPNKGRRIAYVAGGVHGVVACMLSPPRHQEPPARREYQFRLAPYPAPRP